MRAYAHTPAPTDMWQVAASSATASDSLLLVVDCWRDAGAQVNLGGKTLSIGIKKKKKSIMMLSCFAVLIPPTVSWKPNQYRNKLLAFNLTFN